MSYGNPIGLAPVYRDSTGAMYVDPDGIEVGGDSSGALFSGQGRLNHLQHRIQRLQGREAALSARLGHHDQEIAGPTAYNADLRALAAQKGLIVENQFNGLGSLAGASALAGGGTGSLSDTMNRDCWIKSMIMSSDVTAITAVSAITVAGIPINIGSKTMPMEAFARDSVRFGISFGRRLVRSGQQVVVSVANVSAATAVNVQAGLICDEMASYLVQGVAEAGLLAAVNGSGCGSY